MMSRRDRMVVGFTTTNAPMQSMYITTKVVSPNTATGELYSIQHYVVHFFTWYSGFLYK